MPDYLDPVTALQIAEGMDPQFLACRVGRHHAKPESSVINAHFGYRHNTYRCACSLVKHELTELDPPYLVLDSWTDYPTGYILKGFGRPAGDARAVFRGVQIERAFPRPTRMPAKLARETPPPRRKAREALGIVMDDETANVVPLRSARKAG